MLGAGVAIALLLAYARSSAAPERRWVKVNGKILVSRVAFDSEAYQPIVEYVYHYDGLEYRRRNIRSLLVVYNFKGPAERICARYPSGADVEVYVNPQSPSSSVLEPGGDAWLVRLGLPISVLLIVLGAFFVMI